MFDWRGVQLGAPWYSHIYVFYPRLRLAGGLNSLDIDWCHNGYL